MKTGDTVKVYPHGSPECSALGLVALISGNQLSIAVGFVDNPPFRIDQSGGMAFDRSAGRMILLAARELPSGPWTEIFGGGRFEIEAEDSQA